MPSEVFLSVGFAGSHGGVLGSRGGAMGRLSGPAVTYTYASGLGDQLEPRGTYNISEDASGD